MNITALKASFQSDNFRLRLHGALISSAKKGIPVYVKNRKGENFMRVEHKRFDRKNPTATTGFIFTDKKGRVIRQDVVYSMIQGA